MLPDANELVDTLKRAAVEAVEAGKPVNVYFGGERLVRGSLTQTEKRNCSSQNYYDTVPYPKVLSRMIIRVCCRNFSHQVPDLGFSRPTRRYSVL